MRGLVDKWANPSAEFTLKIWIPNRYPKWILD
jgi:hypothetical protein